MAPLAKHLTVRSNALLDIMVIKVSVDVDTQAKPAIGQYA